MRKMKITRRMMLLSFLNEFDNNVEEDLKVVNIQKYMDIDADWIKSNPSTLAGIVDEAKRGLRGIIQSTDALVTAKFEQDKSLKIDTRQVIMLMCHLILAGLAVCPGTKRPIMHFRLTYKNNLLSLNYFNVGSNLNTIKMLLEGQKGKIDKTNSCVYTIGNHKVRLHLKLTLGMYQLSQLTDGTNLLEMHPQIQFQPNTYEFISQFRKSTV